MKVKANPVAKVWRFYAEGFRSMTWGRVLWVLIIAKLLVFFLILRLFFFRPAMENMTAGEKADTVAERLTSPVHP